MLLLTQGAAHGKLGNHSSGRWGRRPVLDQLSTKAMEITDGGSLGSIVGVWAHPDDENYLCGGIMASAVANGHRVVSVTATRGEEGSQDHERWPPKELPAIREAELTASLAALGVGPPMFLDYRDGSCAEVDHDEATQKVAAILDDVRPDTVLTFGPDAMTGHPDHKAVSAWTTDAFHQVAKPGARLYYAVLGAEWADRFPRVMADKDVWGPQGPVLVPSDRLDIDFRLTPELAAMKDKATRAHASQIGALEQLYGLDLMLEFGHGEFFSLAATR